jgi:uncharacterized protein YbaP (TraB family)
VVEVMDPADLETLVTTNRPTSMIRSLKRFVIALSALAGALHAQIPEKHMLFRVHGPNGANVYLLGSVHLLTPDAGALPAVVDSAFDRAKIVAFEASIDTIQMRAMDLLAKARYANGATLKSSLSPAGLAKVDSITKLYGLTIDQVNGFKPWFVSLLLSQIVMQKAGFQPQYGVDVQLNQRAKDAHKTVIGLESVDLQLGLFDSYSAEDQERMLLAAKGPDETAKELAHLKDTWLSGDLVALEKDVDEGETQSATMRAIMLDNRNASWIPRIEALLHGKDDALVVFGAAHLVGNKGVLALLKAKGYHLEQL